MDKVLFALHDAGQREIYGELIRNEGYELVLPRKDKYDLFEFKEMFDKHGPKKIIMDVNYGYPGELKEGPFLITWTMMKNRHYSKNDLMGLTGNSDLLKKMEEKGFNIGGKPINFSDIHSFLGGPKRREELAELVE